MAYRMKSYFPTEKDKKVGEMGWLSGLTDVSSIPRIHTVGGRTTPASCLLTSTYMRMYSLPCTHIQTHLSRCFYFKNKIKLWILSFQDDPCGTL